MNMWRWVAFACLVFFSQVLIAASAPMVIDTDMGRDDMMALLYLLNTPTVNISAIIIDGNGTASCVDGFAHAKQLLKITKHPGIPVACGAMKSLGDGHKIAPRVRQRADAVPVISMSEEHKKRIPRNGVSLLIHTLRSQKQTVLAIGSLTNMALALQRAPDIRSHIKRLYVMGGAVFVAGNVNNHDPNKPHVAEWNIYFDPLASHRVFAAGLPLYLVSLDITNQFPITMAFYHTLTKMKRSAAANIVWQILHGDVAYIPKNVLYFWDPLAAVLAVHPQWAQWKTVRLTVKLTPKALLGATRPSPTGKPIAVAVKAQKQRIIQSFLSTIRR